MIIHYPVLERLKEVRSRPDGWQAQCPCCGGKLRICWAKDGRNVLCCDGCQADSIWEELGMEHPVDTPPPDTLFTQFPDFSRDEYVFYGKTARTADLLHRMGFLALAQDFGGWEVALSLPRSTRLLIPALGMYTEDWKKECIRALQSHGREVWEPDLRDASTGLPDHCATIEGLYTTLGGHRAVQVIVRAVERAAAAAVWAAAGMGWDKVG